MKDRPFILGIGGTPRCGSSSERALTISLDAAKHAGVETLLISGPELILPMYVPGVSKRTAGARRLVDAFRRCTGLIIASPAYHGSVSGLVKNALDYSEDLNGNGRLYFDGLAVGCIACGAGWQASVQTLTALRAIAHALRGWPTPLGVLLNSSMNIFDDNGNCLDPTAKFQLETMSRQVVDFARMRQSRESNKRDHEAARISGM